MDPLGVPPNTPIKRIVMVIVVVSRVDLVELNTPFLQYAKKVEKLAAGRYAILPLRRKMLQVSPQSYLGTKITVLSSPFQTIVVTLSC